VGFRSGGIKFIRGVGWWASRVRGEVVASVLYLAVYVSATGAGGEEEGPPRLKCHVVVVAAESRQRSRASQRGEELQMEMRRSKTMLYTGCCNSLVLHTTANM